MFVKNIYLRNELTKKYYLENKFSPLQIETKNLTHYEQNNSCDNISGISNQCVSSKKHSAIHQSILERGFFGRQNSRWLD